MSKLIRASGEIEDVHPADGKAFTLTELQTHVGGFIELMPGVPFQLLMDEDGRRERLPENVLATALVLAALRLQLAAHPDLTLRYEPRLVGDVLLLDDAERMTGG